MRHLSNRGQCLPLGDMAVGTMVLKNHNYMNLSGPSVSLTLNNAAAKDALMAWPDWRIWLSFRAEGLKIKATQFGVIVRCLTLVSLAFKEENYAKAFNSFFYCWIAGGLLEDKCRLNLLSKFFAIYL